MSPREVSSLNAIAKAHGGQLTTNPHTGLPEAGFLESILPMAAGFALNAALPGSGMLVPALVGGGVALMSGSLEKGLMAGLGAYGGANLGTSLAQQGVEQATAQQLAQDQGFQAVQAQAAGNAASLGQAPVNFANEAFVGPHMPAAYDPTAFTTQAQNITEPVRQAQAAALEKQTADYAGKTFGEKMSQNFSTLTSPGGASGLFDKVTSSPMSLLKTVGASSAPGVSEAMKPKPQEEEKADTSMGQRYAYDSGYVNPMPGASASGQEQTYMNPSYRPVSDEQAKKIYGFADGGATPAPSPASYTAAEPATPISTPAPAFSIPEVDSLSDLIRAKESQRFIDAYLNRPAPIDVQGQYNDYLQKTLNAPPMAVANSGVRAAVANPNPNAASDAEYVYDANTRQYVPNPKHAEAEATKAKAKKKPSIGSIGGLGPGRAEGGSISESKSAPIDVQAQYNDYLQRTLNTSPASAPNSGVRAAVANPSRAETAAAEKKLNIGSDGGFSLGRSTGLSTNNNEELGNALRSTVNKIGSDIHQIRFATGGGISDAQYNLGGYSDGGRLLRGPGDGVSDSIPAVIGKKQPARLADGEFVVPARIVSELGNGSTEAGARKLYAMMDRIQKARGKTVGKGKVAKNSRSEKYLPA
jgi:hypothetical protein